MLNINERVKVKNFIADSTMSGAVKKVLNKTFMKDRGGDVYLKAAQMTAINLLEESFKELEKQSRKIEANEKKPQNQGL